MSVDKEKPQTYQWIINTLIALLAAGGGIVALLTYLEQHYYWPFDPKTTRAVPELSKTGSTPPSGPASLASDAWLFTSPRRPDPAAKTLLSGRPDELRRKFSNAI